MKVIRRRRNWIVPGSSGYASIRHAARRALQAGAKVVEIHAAHGYLLHSFSHPSATGAPINTAIHLKTASGFFVRRSRKCAKCGRKSIPLFVRISSTDWIEGGWTGGDAVALAKKLKPLGVDLIDCSSGGNVPNAKIQSAPATRSPFAAQIRSEAEIVPARSA